MLLEFTSYIENYGCLAIMLLVFLQEAGVPNPIPNELVLIFSGYLSFTGILHLPLVILSVIIGDFLGSVVLFSVFYFGGKLIVKHKPKWIPISKTKILRISHKIKKSGDSGIFVGRLTPFVKGYVSVMCGLMHVEPRKYTVILLLTSIIWALLYVCCGYFAGPYWKLISQYDLSFTQIMLLILCTIVGIIAIIQAFKRLPALAKQVKLGNIPIIKCDNVTIKSHKLITLLIFSKIRFW